MSTAIRWCTKKDLDVSGACGICLEPLRESGVVTPCQHIFCHDCIYTLFSYGDVQVPCPCCRKAVSPYSVFDLTESKPLKEAELSSPFGHTFVQLGRQGLASYHLNSPENCYISYENAPESWKMDDGSRMPRRKELTDVKFHRASRQLTARYVLKEAMFRVGARTGFLIVLYYRVDWAPGSLSGASEWRVVMKFDEGYRAIYEGEVAVVRSDGAMLRKNFFGTQLRYRRAVSTVFGSAYIQGNCLGLASYHFVSEDECYISYARAFDCWRLDDGSKPPLKKPFKKVSYNPTVCRTSPFFLNCS